MAELGGYVPLPGQQQLDEFGNWIGDKWRGVAPRFDPTQRPAITFGDAQPPAATPAPEDLAAMRAASGGLAAPQAIGQHIETGDVGPTGEQLGVVPDSVRAGAFQAQPDSWTHDQGGNVYLQSMTRGQMETDAGARALLEARDQQQRARIDLEEERNDPTIRQIGAAAKDRKLEELQPAGAPPRALISSDQERGAFRKEGKTFVNEPRPGGLSAGEASKAAIAERLKRAEGGAKAQGELDVKLGMIGALQQAREPIDRKLGATVQELDRRLKAGQIDQKGYDAGVATAQSMHKQMYDQLVADFLTGTGGLRRTERSEMSPDFQP